MFKIYDPWGKKLNNESDYGWSDQKIATFCSPFIKIAITLVGLFGFCYHLNIVGKILIAPRVYLLEVVTKIFN